MGFIPRRRIKENLRDVQVFLEDRDNTVFKVQDITDTFVQGRSAFKLFGSEFLKPNVKLKIEILDKVVYVQPVKYGEIFSPKLPYRYVSVEVYPPPINLPGEAELVILGELDDRIEIFERLYNDIPGADPFEIESQYQRKFSVLFSLSPGLNENSTSILSKGILGKNVQRIIPKENNILTNRINNAGVQTCQR